MWDVVDAGDPRLEPYRGLRDPVLRRKCEPAEGDLRSRGQAALRAALSSPYPLASVLVLRRRLGVLDDVRLPAGVPVYVADADVMSQVAGFDVHRGLLAIARRLAGVPVAELLARTSGSRLLVVAEGTATRKTWAPSSATRRRSAPAPSCLTPPR